MPRLPSVVDARAPTAPAAARNAPLIVSEDCAPASSARDWTAMRLRRRPTPLEASRDVAVVPSSTPRTVGAGRAVVRSGTALEVAELAWIGEGISRELALTIPTMP